MTADAPGRPIRVAAFFDVDNTLLRGASLFQLARGARRLGIVGTGDLVRFGWEAMRFRQRGERLSVLDLVRARATRLLAGQSADRLHGLATEVVDRLHGRLWPETRDLLRAHVASGHQVWLLSATPDFLAAELAARLGATGGLGTPLEIDEHGLFTGRFAGPTMHAEAKAVAARRILAAAGIDPAACFAYSDSINDLPLLTSVGTAVAVNPDRELAARAAAAGWRVLRMNPASIRAERRRVRKHADLERRRV